jgi:hypothetical protein
LILIGAPETKGADRLPRKVRERPVASTKFRMPPVDSRSLEAFIISCTSRQVEYRLSLKQLAREAVAGQRNGRIPKDVRTFYGMNWFFGFAVINREGDSDVLLLGMRDPRSPALDIDCLATAIQAVARGSEPMCSLDPSGDRRFQQSVIRGVPWDSRFARVMIQADYTMKKISQGFLTVRGVPSYFDRKAEAFALPRFAERAPESNEAKGPDSKETSRFWFTRDASDTVPRGVIITKASDGKSADVLILFRNPVVLLTEKQVDGKFGTGKVGAEAEWFAKDFTANMARLGREYPSIGELLALYRLLAVMLHLRVVGRMEPPGLDFWLHEYKADCKGPPKLVPSLWRYGWLEEGNVRHELWVEGGVKMPLSLDPAAVKIDEAHGLKRRIAGLQTEPATLPAP